MRGCIPAIVVVVMLCASLPSTCTASGRRSAMSSACTPSSRSAAAASLKPELQCVLPGADPPSHTSSHPVCALWVGGSFLPCWARSGSAAGAQEHEQADQVRHERVLPQEAGGGGDPRLVIRLGRELELGRMKTMLYSFLGQTHASRKTKGKIEVPEERSF